MTTRIKMIVPIPMDGAGWANRRAQLGDEDIGAGYEVDFVAVEAGPTLVSSGVHPGQKVHVVTMWQQWAHLHEKIFDESVPRLPP